MPAAISDDAHAANERAGALIDERRFAEAIPDAELAAQLAPAWPTPWFNLTVAYKHAHRWRDCLDAAERVLASGPDEGAHWNAGIAATALGEWHRARAAWTAVGIPVPDGRGPITMALGPTPVRIAPGDSAEVVWCTRLDPCRARITSVPLPASGRRCGDVVLHDGEPRGHRRLGERSLAVFDELTRLETSPLATWELTVDVAGPDELRALLAPIADHPHEDWTHNIRPLCAACSLGEPHDHQDAATEPVWQRRRRIGVAAASAAALRPLRRWFGWVRGVVAVERLG